MAEVLRNLRTQIGQAFSVDEMSSNDMRLLNNAPPATQTMATSHQNSQMPHQGDYVGVGFFFYAVRCLGVSLLVILPIQPDILMTFSI